MNFLLLLEIFSVVTGLGFIVLMIYQKIWAWPIGIISSLSSIYLFYCSKLYAETILYFYYVLIGIYGWYIWKKNRDRDFTVQVKSVWYAIVAVTSGAVLSVLLGFILAKSTDSPRPFADATSTIFSLIASYMEAHKVLSSWLFWIVINLFSIWLYLDRGLKIYSGLMVIFFLFSVAGYIQWKHSYQKSIGEAAINTKEV